MSEQELPPWVREQISRLQQLQQNLQAIMMQKQQLEVEMVETDRALQELKKASPDDAIYKNAGSVLIKTKKEDILKEVENKINEMIRGMQAGGSSPAGSTGNAGPRSSG